MILDTNAVSAIADGDTLLDPVLRRMPLAALPVIVIGEFRYGIRQSRNRKQYEVWLEGMLASCRILLLDERTAERYAEVLPLLSRNRHFDAVPGLNRIGW